MGRHSIFILILSTLVGVASQATVVFRGASGVSSFSEIADTAGTLQITVFGGIAGTCTSNTSTCNTCNSTTALTPCNPRAVNPNLVVRIQGQSNSIAVNRRGLLRFESDTGALVNGTGILMDGAGTFAFETTWGDLCNAMGNSGCTSDSAALFRFGVTEDGSGFVSGEVVNIRVVMSNATSRQWYTRCMTGAGGANDGFCEVNVFPGDGKVYADDLKVASTFPTAGGSSDVKWTKLVFFYTPYTPGEDIRATVLPRIANGTSRLEITYDNVKNPPEVDTRVDGLENGQPYCFIMANADTAGNIGNFTNFADNSQYANNTELEDLLCATPQNVVGLLDDKSCFIATAAWGSPLDPHVETLRAFRDRFLKTHPWGAAFVEAYYQWSPRWADWISQNEVAQSLVRLALWPLAAFAWVSLEVGLMAAIAGLLGVIILGSFVLTPSLRRRRSQ